MCCGRLRRGWAGRGGLGGVDGDPVGRRCAARRWPRRGAGSTFPRVRLAEREGAARGAFLHAGGCGFAGAAPAARGERARAVLGRCFGRRAAAVLPPAACWGAGWQRVRLLLKPSHGSVARNSSKGGGLAVLYRGHRHALDHSLGSARRGGNGRGRTCRRASSGCNVAVLNSLCRRGGFQRARRQALGPPILVGWGGARRVVDLPVQGRRAPRLVVLGVVRVPVDAGASRRSQLHIF
jgi:hypothetical protein